MPKNSPQLPAELLIEVIANISTNQHRSPSRLFHYPTTVDSVTRLRNFTLKQLSLSNETLRSIAQPILFAHIDISGDQKKCLTKAQTLLRMVDTRNGSHEWVKTLYFRWFTYGNWKYAEVDKEADMLAETVSIFFVRLTQVRDVAMFGIELSDEMYNHLYHIPTLRSLCLENVYTKPFTNSSQAVEGLAIEELELGVDSEGSTADTARALTRLAQSPRLHSMKISALTSPIYEALMGDPPRTFAAVTEVSINGGAQLGHAIGLLSACPKAMSFRWGIPGERERLEPLPALPEGLVSLLGKVTGPLDVVRMFAPGRPVETIVVLEVDIGCYQWSREALIPLTFGSVTLKELTLSSMWWREDAMDIISELFPLLTTLKLSFMGGLQVSLVINSIYCRSLTTLSLGP